MQTQQLAFVDDEAPVTLTWQPIAHEEAIISILDAGPQADETLQLAFSRIERELCAMFTHLALADAKALHRRLTLCLPDDPIATRFARLICERRGRLMNYLAAAPRREAIRRAR